MRERDCQTDKETIRQGKKERQAYRHEEKDTQSNVRGGTPPRIEVESEETINL